MLTQDLLEQFEQGLNPACPDQSQIPARIVGYGEISAIFTLAADPVHVYKRLPVFDTAAAADRYARLIREYCTWLERAGLTLPEYSTATVAIKGRPVSLYIAQTKLPQDLLAHRLIHRLDRPGALCLIKEILEEIDKVWALNRDQQPGICLAIDGQLSNWARGEDSRLYYIDTSTPIFCRDGVEQLDPELLLKSAPGFLRWVIRLFFLKDVMARYYVPRLVMTDLVANLYKEQKMDLIDPVIDLVNARLPRDQAGLTRQEVDRYYREDKLIWRLFLSLRRLDRTLTTRLCNRRYEFILPGNIKR